MPFNAKDWPEGGHIGSLTVGLVYHNLIYGIEHGSGSVRAGQEGEASDGASPFGATGGGRA
jgi:hypothetical protein